MSGDTGRTRRRRSDAEHNRASIIATAVEVLSEQGELRMDDVAAAAGVSRSTVYRHFRTRSSLEAALREDALTAARDAVQGIVSEDRTPLALMRRLVEALVEISRKRRLDRLGALPLGIGVEPVSQAVLPALDRLRRAADIAPSPPAAWLEKAGAHLVNACLEAGARPLEPVRETADRLFRSLAEPLDQGLVLVDADGRLLCSNARGARTLDPSGRVEPGERLTSPHVEDLYEDGSPSPAGTYPLSAAVRTGERQSAVRGHRGPNGALRWLVVEATPLREPGRGSVYGVVGILSDVTAEREWEQQRLRPAGQLASRSPLPLDIGRTLDEIPPPLFPEQFVSEARRVSGGPVALYVLDIDGTHLLRLAGPEQFPAHLDAPLALGPELAQDGIPKLRARLHAELPGVVIVPMWLRGRAIGLLLALRGPEEPLVELARLGAAALELARGYTDVVDSSRRRKETHAAAELQQSLIPARIARMSGVEVAGSVLPSYEVGGDWFDYVENRDGAWIAVADAVGKGATAGALGSIALAALRAARRSEQSLEAAVKTMHEVVYDAGRPEFFVTAIVARWDAVYSTFSWINCGHPPPVIVRPDDTLEQLKTEAELPLGILERKRRFVRRQRRLEPGERLILHSDGITARRTGDGLFGLDGIERAVRSAENRSATAIGRAIQEAVMQASEDPLQDDAVAVVLAPQAAPGLTLVGDSAAS